jgi:alpha-amylase
MRLTVKQRGEKEKMPDVCMGFEVHQPYRLNRFFAPNSKITSKNLDELYFDTMNREVLERVADKCYVPATKIILEKLDEGFHCSFSLSGTLVEQLEKWRPDALSLFSQVACHKNAEILAQTYYHSIASCFADKSEFEEQVRMHVDLMHDLFGTRPTVFENTEFTFNNEIAAHIRSMGFSGIFTEGVDRILGWRSPHHVYSCRDIPVLLRDIPLSDDIAFRFANTSWDKFPLTADTYAGWLAASAGEVITLFLDYETFGEHFWQETGIFNFLRYLPEEMAKKGISTVLPSDVIDRHPPVGTIEVTETISWADIEKDTSAWMGNDRQQTALSAVQKAQAFASDKKIWRYLQTSDHFYYMASKFGTCGEVHVYFSHQEIEDAFCTYMRILSDFEKRNIRNMKNRKAAKTLMTVPPEHAFHFACPTGYIGYSAYNLDQFLDLLAVVPQDSITFHLQHGHFAHWFRFVLDDKNLADSMHDQLRRQELEQIVRERKELLWSHLR